MVAPTSVQRINGHTGGLFPDRPVDRLALEVLLSDTRSAGGSLADLVSAASSTLDCVAYLVTPEERIVARAVPVDVTSGSIPRLPLLLSPQEALSGEPRMVQVDECWYVCTPVGPPTGPFGWLILRAGLSQGSRDDIEWVARRVAGHLAGEVAAQRRLARVAWNARANLGRQMIRGSSYDADLRACAEYLGVDLDADRIVVFVLERGRSSTSTVDSGRLADLMAASLGVEVLPIRGTEGVLLAVAVPGDGDRALMLGRVKGATITGLETMGDEFAVAGLSSVTRPGQLRRAYREAREVARCLDRYASAATRVLASDELGPARLLVANSDEHAVRTYVFDVLGGLLNGGSSNIALLRTLQTFFEHGRSIRESAVALDVHENTVRHRLAKVQELVGLDVASNSNDQLSVQTALLVLRLQGHHAVPAFDRARLS